MTSGEVSVDHIDGDVYEIHVRGHHLTVDQPIKAGGTDKAPTPAGTPACDAISWAEALRGVVRLTGGALGQRRAWWLRRIVLNGARSVSAGRWAWPGRDHRPGQEANLRRSVDGGYLRRPAMCFVVDAGLPGAASPTPQTPDVLRLAAAAGERDRR
jgi:hypothetical protein